MQYNFSVCWVPFYHVGEGIFLDVFMLNSRITKPPIIMKNWQVMLQKVRKKSEGFSKKFCFFFHDTSHHTPIKTHSLEVHAKEKWEYFCLFTLL